MNKEDQGVYSEQRREVFIVKEAHFIYLVRYQDFVICLVIINNWFINSIFLEILGESQEIMKRI